jgi:hypothetical protein
LASVAWHFEPVVCNSCCQHGALVQHDFALTMPAPSLITGLFCAILYLWRDKRVR